MERMVEVVPNSNWQSLQNFLSHSPWRERGLLDQLDGDANHLIGGNIDSCFILCLGVTSPNKKSSGKCLSDINNGLRRLNSTGRYKF